MTDTTTEAVQTFADDLQRLQFEQLNNLINTRNSLVGQINAASGDRLTLLETIRENSTDPEIMEAREQMSKWALKLDELCKPLVEQIIADAKGSVEEFEQQVKAHDATLKTGISYYKKMYGDEAASFFTKQARVKGATVGRAGSGTRRIRGWNVTVTIDGDDVTFENFSSAAKHVGVDTVDLQKAFFAKAGNDDPKKIEATEVKFVINFVEVDDDENETEKEAFIVATKQETDDAPAAVETPAEPEATTDELDDFDPEDL